MDNILILGVEGSGKTVLAMAFAKVFADHADAGLRLKPENRAAFRFLEQMPASLYAVPRPPEQPGRYTDLRFTVCRGQEDLLALDVPECPPELFHAAFKADSEQAASTAPDEALKDDLKALRARIAGASRVLVLFDVSLIRGGDGEEQPAHLDAVWATNACIRHLLGLPYPPSVALVLTHADRDPASGNDFAAILRRRLPLLADNYPALPGFAVSSVKPDDPEVGLQPLLFSLFEKTAPLDGLLDEARRVWSPLAAPEKDAPAPDAEALRAAADRLDALRGQAPWYAQGSHALFLAPEAAAKLRQLADEPEAGTSVADSLKAAFPLLAAPAPRRETPRTHSHGSSRSHSSHSSPATGTGKATPGAAAALGKGPATAPAQPSSHHHHHHRHHGGRHTPNRRFFRRVMRYLPWVLATILLALALHYGVPAARRAYGRRCLDRGLRIFATRPDDARKALLAARKYRAAGADLALVHGRLSGTDSEAAAADFDACRWTYTRPADIAQFHGVIRHIQRLADSGDSNARYLVARMLDEGKGANRDPEGAFRLMVDAAVRQQSQAMLWLVAKATGGDTEAQAALGRLYLAGQGPDGHDTEAVRWVLVAGNHGAEGAPEWLDAQAEAGNAAAQFVVGRKAELRARKTGDNAPAIDWYRKAAAQGNADAIKALARLGVDPAG